MKVVSKFAITFFVAACACLAVFSYVFANREAARVERFVATGLASYGQGLRDAVEVTARQHGDDAAARLLSGFRPTGVLRVSLERARGASIAHDEPRIETATRADGTRVVRASFQVARADGEPDALMLERAVLDGSAVIRAELGDQVFAVAALAVTMAAIAAVLGAVVIGDPLSRIVAQARRIGDGDFSQRLRSNGRDEIGALKRELNAMCDRLVDAHVKLEEESAARVETLEQLRHLDRLRTVGTVASSIAHELGTPLNVVLLRGQSLASGEVAGAEDAGRAIVAQVEKMSRIVRQLLAFTRARPGSHSAPASEVDLLALARHASTLLGSLAKKHGVKLVIEGREGVCARGDFGQLEQALTNLIVNGVQSMANGGRLTIRVTADEQRRRAYLEVTDEGDGIDPELIERIFDPFFTTKPGSSGTGLGLHVARGIAADHSGSISVRSEKGVGTTFRLELPWIE